MPRPPRYDLANYYYHLFNRMNGLGTMFLDPSYYREFLHVLGESAESFGMRILAYCVMPNHWHLLVRPRLDGDLARFMHRLTQRHSHLWHIRRGIVGRGSLYQGRYGSCLIQSDRYLLTVCRYIERNPVRANLVASALDWPWSSAQVRARALGLTAVATEVGPRVALEDLPLAVPTDWLRWLDEPHTAAELAGLRRHLRRGKPYGDAAWSETMSEREPDEKVPGTFPEKVPGTFF